MKKIVHVLAIDDHAVVLQGYFSLFKHLDGFDGLTFNKACDCKSGADIIITHKDQPFDIAVIDYSIPHYAEKKLFSGEDMAMLVREYMPTCKIVMMTMHKEVDIMGSILNNVDPEGFINKSDCSTEELIEGFSLVLDGGTYYSKTVANYIRLTEKGMLLEEMDIKILSLLAKGIKNKNLIKYIPLSDSGIEKRKYRIKRLLEVEGDDEALIAEARRKGYL